MTTNEKSLEQVLKENPSIDGEVVKAATEQLQKLADAGLVEGASYRIEPALGISVALPQHSLRCENSRQGEPIGFASFK